MLSYGQDIKIKFIHSFMGIMKAKAKIPLVSNPDLLPKKVEVGSRFKTKVPNKKVASIPTKLEATLLSISANRTFLHMLDAKDI